MVAGRGSVGVDGSMDSGGSGDIQKYRAAAPSGGTAAEVGGRVKGTVSRGGDGTCSVASLAAVGGTIAGWGALCGVSSAGSSRAIISAAGHGEYRVGAQQEIAPYGNGQPIRFVCYSRVGRAGPGSFEGGAIALDREIGKSSAAGIPGWNSDRGGIPFRLGPGSGCDFEVPEEISRMCDPVCPSNVNIHDIGVPHGLVETGFVQDDVVTVLRGSDGVPVRGGAGQRIGAAGDPSARVIGRTGKEGMNMKLRKDGQREFGVERVGRLRKGTQPSEEGMPGGWNGGDGETTEVGIETVGVVIGDRAIGSCPREEGEGIRGIIPQNSAVVGDDFPPRRGLSGCSRVLRRVRRGRENRRGLGIENRG